AQVMRRNPAAVAGDAKRPLARRVPRLAEHADRLPASVEDERAVQAPRRKAPLQGRTQVIDREDGDDAGLTVLHELARDANLPRLLVEHVPRHGGDFAPSLGRAVEPLS